MKKKLENIIDTLRGLNPTLQKQFAVETIELFGSYSRMENNSKSDLDLLVTFSKTPGLQKFIALENFLTDEIGIKVDLVMKNSLKPRLRNSILNSSLPI